MNTTLINTVCFKKLLETPQKIRYLASYWSDLKALLKFSAYFSATLKMSVNANVLNQIDQALNRAS